MIKDLLAYVGGFAVACWSLFIIGMWLDHRRSQRRKRHADLAAAHTQVRATEAAPDRLDDRVWDLYVQEHGLSSIKPPKEWRR
ncbi:hypothetical protein [Streptosporangium saharense]|uniref:Uncharacterized protein n=1 Tax=Streptosporangium saharense TaxID=1706840 RepID=A0A7W7QKB5_9ACTN|nr:hypothetical protein [Streptosporangium saharense]MBB4915068.1 hypothetical protein [Streptosporangium saharense]